MKSLAVIVPYFFPPYIGGTETVLRKWDRYFSERDTPQVKFVLPFAYRDSNVFGHEKNYYYGCRIFNNHWMRYVGIINLVSYLIFTRTQYIVVLSPNYIKLAKLVRSIFHKHYRIVSWIHFSLEHKFTEQSTVFKEADYHLAISTGIRRQLMTLGIPANRIFTVFNPVAESSAVIQSSSEPKFVYVGRLESRRQKNLHELIEAFAMLSQELPQAKLELWGSGTEVLDLQLLVIKQGLENVYFKGWSNDPWAQITTGTAFVLTSTYEGLPMSILESLSRGLPVISSDIATGPEDEVVTCNGLLYRSGDVRGLKEAMLTMYQQSQNFQTTDIKKSIEKFYECNYFNNLTKVFEEMR